MADIDANNVNFNFETEQEVDGRWIAEIIDLPGVMAYGPTQEEAIAHATALARIAKHTGLKPSDL
jgi:predicted RNase H-like HicB family nuclease